MRAVYLLGMWRSMRVVAMPPGGGGGGWPAGAGGGGAGEGPGAGGGGAADAAVPADAAVAAVDAVEVVRGVLGPPPTLVARCRWAADAGVTGEVGQWCCGGGGVGVAPV